MGRLKLEGCFADPDCNVGVTLGACLEAASRLKILVGEDESDGGGGKKTA